MLRPWFDCVGFFYFEQLISLQTDVVANFAKHFNMAHCCYFQDDFYEQVSRIPVQLARASATPNRTDWI